MINESKFVCIVEEGTEGGTWGSEVSSCLNKELTISEFKILTLNSMDSIIPSSRHLESKSSD